MSACSASLPEAYDLRVACSADDFASFARLACDYHDWLGLDLRFQNFEQEVASLPGCYAAPTGCILLISHTESTAEVLASPSPSVSTQDVACVAIRPLSQHHGEQSLDHITAAAAVANQSATEAAGPPNNTQQSAQPDSHRTVASIPPNHRTCELKRLWVSQQHQKQGLGRALTVAALQAAEGMGYQTMVLDTLETLASANRLYEGLGFRRRKPYYYNPPAGMFVRRLHKPLHEQLREWLRERLREHHDDR